MTEEECVSVRDEVQVPAMVNDITEGKWVWSESQIQEWGVCSLTLESSWMQMEGILTLRTWWASKPEFWVMKKISNSAQLHSDWFISWLPGISCGF